MRVFLGHLVSRQALGSGTLANDMQNCRLCSWDKQWRKSTICESYLLLSGLAGTDQESETTSISYHTTAFSLLLTYHSQYSRHHVGCFFYHAATTATASDTCHLCYIKHC